MYRQGDILLIPTTYVPPASERVYEKRQKGQGIIIAEGEATGHHHRIRSPHARTYRVGRGSAARRFLTVPKSGATLTHEEHEGIALAPGTYEVRNQREYEAPSAEEQMRVRRVFD